MTEVEVYEEEERRLPPRAYLVGALAQFAVGLHAPFLQTYLVDMQMELRGVLNYAELGAFRSVGNVAPTLLQPAWGAASDKVGHSKYFVAFGTLSGLLAVFLFLWTATPVDLIVLYGVQSVLFSIQIPTWLSLIGSLMGERNRGTELGKLTMITNIASLSATIASGFLAGLPALVQMFRTVLGPAGQILFPVVDPWREAYYLPFYLTAVVGITASVLSLLIKERGKETSVIRRIPPIHRLLAQPGEFRRFSFVAVFFSFAMSMAWPYFIVVQRDWLENSLLEIAIASAIMTLSTTMFTIPLGRMSDRVGRKPMILMGRGLLFVVPLMYAFSREIGGVYMIYAANAVAGFCIASAVNAITAYIYDVAPKEERGSHLAVYNTFTGIVYLAGSLIAGIIGELLSGILGGQYLAVFIMMLLSAGLRFVASFMYLFIREPKQYDSTLRLEIMALIHRRRHDADTV
jgi:MFS family permease